MKIGNTGMTKSEPRIRRRQRRPDCQVDVKLFPYRHGQRLRRPSFLFLYDAIRLDEI